MGCKSRLSPSKVRKKNRTDLRTYPLRKRHMDKLLRLEREKTSTSGPSLDMTVTSSPGCDANLVLTYDDGNEEDVTWDKEISVTVQPQLQVRQAPELFDTIDEDDCPADTADPAITLLASLARTRRQKQQVVQQFTNPTSSQVNMTRGDFCILCKTERNEVLDRVGILFHRFPRSNRPKSVDRWTEVLTHAGCLVPDRLPMTAALCSLHFDAEQYTSKLIRSTGEHKRVLRRCSMPSLLLRNVPGNKEYPMRRQYKRREEVAARRLPPTRPFVEVDSDDEPQLVMDIPLDEDENSNMSQQEPRQWTPSVSSSDNLCSTPQPNNVMPESVQLPGYYNNPPQQEKTTEVDPLSICDTTFAEPSVDVQPQSDIIQQDTQLSADIQIASYYSLNEEQCLQQQTESNATDLDVMFLSQQVSSNVQQEDSSNISQMPVEIKREKFHIDLQDFEEDDMKIPELAKKYFYFSQNALEAHSTDMMKLKETLQAREKNLKTIIKLNNKHEAQVTKLTNFYRNMKKENAALKQEVQRLIAPCEIPNCHINRNAMTPHMRPVTPFPQIPYNGYRQYPSPALPSASSTRMENNYSNTPFIPQSRTHPYLRQILNQRDFSSFQRPAISQSPSVFNTYNPMISKTNPPPYTPNNNGYAENFHLSNLQRNNFNTPPKFEFPCLPNNADGYQNPQTPTTVPSFQNPNTSSGYQSPHNGFAPLNSVSSIHNSNSSSIIHGFQSPAQTANGVQSPQNGSAPLNNATSNHNNPNSSTVNHGFQTPAQSPNTANGFGPIVSPNIPTQSGYISSASSDSSQNQALFSPSHNSNTQNQAVFSPTNSPNVGYNNETVQHNQSNDNNGASTSNSAVPPSQSEFPNNSDYLLNVQVNEYQNTQQTVATSEQNVKTSLPQQNTTTWFPPAYQPSSDSWSM